MQTHWCGMNNVSYHRTFSIKKNLTYKNKVAKKVNYIEIWSERALKKKSETLEIKICLTKMKKENTWEITTIKANICRRIRKC